MKANFRLTNKSLPRRTFLKGLGVGLSLPFLDAMIPAVVKANSMVAKELESPKRMIGICNNLGVLPEKFFPKNPGKNYELSPYLKTIEQYRNDFTVFSGVWHPDVDGGHPADICFLTAAPHPGSGGFRNTISLDQYVAEQQGHLTRFPAMTWGVNTKGGSRSLSWTGAGVVIPAEEKPSQIYKQLFLQGTKEEVAEQVRKLELGKSIMDTVMTQTKSLKRGLGSKDKDRLDQYMTGVRDLEQRLIMTKQWELKPKPKASSPMPEDYDSPAQYMDKVKSIYQMAKLAVESDSTRAISIMLDSVSTPTLDLHDEVAITDGYHSLSHHGKNEAKLKQLEAIDTWHMKLLGELFGSLKETKEKGGNLLDQTMIVYGSNMGNAHTHVTTNLPVLFAGGGFKHGQHLAFDTQRNYPLPNLFVSMLQNMGLEVDSFSTSTGTMRGLEVA